MDWMNVKKRTGFAAGAALVGVLLAGCGGGSVPNQRVYDRYATLMQERYRQQMQAPSQSVVESAPAQPAAPEVPAKTVPVPDEPKKKHQSAPEVKNSTKPNKPTKAESAPAPVPVPAPKPEASPAVVPEVPVAEPPVEIVSEPDLFVLPEPPPVIEPEPEPEPEPLAPAPVEVVPPAEPIVPPPQVPSYDMANGSDAAKDEASAYTLKIGDGVQITLRGIPTPEKIECQVDEYGMVALPLINDVKAEGLSGAELAKNIRQIYLERGIYKNINVTVLIPTRYYFTQGEFKSTGKFQLVSAINLSQAIAGSGYFTDFANGRVFIRRNGVIFKTVNNAKRLDRTPEDDILIEPGDIIEAQRSRW